MEKTEGIIGRAFLRKGTEFFSLVTSEGEEGYVLFTFGKLGGDRLFRPEEKMSRQALEASLPHWQEVSMGNFRAAYAEAVDFLRAFYKNW